MSQNIELIKKNALLTLEISPDTKTNVTIAHLNQFLHAVKKISTKKEILIIVLDA